MPIFKSDCDSSDSVQILQRSTQQSLFKYTHKMPPHMDDTPGISPLFSTSPFSAGMFLKNHLRSQPIFTDSQRLLKSPRKPQRKVPKNPYKV
jgi:hypothetical protein